MCCIFLPIIDLRYCYLEQPFNALHDPYRFQYKMDNQKTNAPVFTKIPTGYLKNHWTKHMLVCTHFDAFCMLIPNMDIKFKNSEIFKNFVKISIISGRPHV